MRAELDLATAAHAPGCPCPRCQPWHGGRQPARSTLDDVRLVLIAIAIPLGVAASLVVTPQQIVAGIAAAIGR